MSTTSLLPPNATPLERALESSHAVRIAALPSIVSSLWNSASCPTELLPYLAWSLSVDEWDESWSEGRKRHVIAQARLIHQQKGTPAAIRRALATLGQPDITIIERGDYIRRDGSALRNGTHLRKGSGGWATYRIILRSPVTVPQAHQIKRLLASVQRNCITLTAIDFKASSIRRNGKIKRNGLYSRGVVNTSI